MTDTRIIIIGAGHHAKVIIELIRSHAPSEIVGLTDADPTRGRVLGVEVLGDDAILPRIFAEGVRHAFVALGDNQARMAAAERALEIGFSLVNAVSPHAHISPTARLGAGIAIMAGAIINADAVVEDLVIINTGAVVEHDVRLGMACHVGPGAVLAGGVVVGAGAFLGAGATVVPRRSIGAAATVGAGACVIADLAPRAIAAGVPARLLPSVPECST